MDAADEIPQGVSPETPLHSPIQAVALTKVLDDDNLLREIIVRVGFPITLVRAALVCKRWLGHASDPKFLSRFRKLHPPRLLGYYISEQFLCSQMPDIARFVPMLPQPPELAAVMRRVKSYNFGAHKIMDCQNGKVFTMRHEGTRWTHGVHHPLCAETDMQILPPLPHVQEQNTIFYQIISKQEGNNMSYLYVLGEATETRVYMLQDGEWLMRTSATCPNSVLLYPIDEHIGHNKIYLPSAISDDIIVLDLMALSYSTIQLPQGVKYRYLGSMLSRADDASSVYLIHVEEFQLRVWLHKGDNWLLVDTICLHDMLDTLGMSGHMLENEGIADVLIRQVGDNGQFVILQVGQCIFYLDSKCRALCKVYENTVNGRHLGCIYPFMMIWPPTFPALKDDALPEMPSTGAKYCFSKLKEMEEMETDSEAGSDDSDAETLHPSVIAQLEAGSVKLSLFPGLQQHVAPVPAGGKNGVQCFLKGLRPEIMDALMCWRKLRPTKEKETWKYLLHLEGRVWRSVKEVLGNLSSLLHQWKILCTGQLSTLLMQALRRLDYRRGELHSYGFPGADC